MRKRQLTLILIADAINPGLRDQNRLTDEKREAQNKLVKMVLPGMQRAAI